MVLDPVAVARTQKLSRRRTWRAIVVAGALILGIGIAAYVYYRVTRTNSPAIESIAVMPFINESGNADLDYLSDGMTEALIGSLSQLPKLNVKARSSVFRYKGKETNAKTVGKDLQVQAILNGRVVQHGDLWTLSLELVDAQTENVIWTERYNRKQADLVTLPIDIARDVSNKLKTRLSGFEEAKLTKTFTASPEAYQLYLKGRFYWNKRTPRDLQKSVEYFQQAAATDPNYALAFAGLSDAHTLVAAFGGAPPREVMPRAKEEALKAISLDNQLAEPYVALGHIAEYYDYDLVEAERYFQKGIELNPNYSIAHEFYGTLLSNLGRHEQAEKEIRRALEIEPVSLGTNRMYGEALLFARRYDESIVQLKKTIELDESFASAHRSLARAYLVTRNYAGHVEEAARYFDLIGEPQTATSMRESFAKGGWTGYLRAMTGPTRPTRFFFPFYVAMYFAELGDKDKAFAWLEKTYEERLYYVAWMNGDPCLDSLRDDPRFQQLVKRINLPR
jgi:TolB-like protein